MARTVVFNLDGEVSEFAISSLRREKLYGKKVKVVVDESGEETQTAYLTRDGSALLPPGSMSSLYMDDEFNVVERRDLIAVDQDGEKVEEVASTLGTEVPLQGPVEPSRVLDHIAKAVYMLDPAELGDSLRESLENGNIYETRFNYRTSFDDAPAFLLANDEGHFLIVGDEATFDFLTLDRSQDVADDDEDEDPFEDDLDFSMF